MGEAVIVEVGDGELAVVPDAQPATTIELTVAGLRGLVAGLHLSRIAATGDVAIHGDRQGGRALLDRSSGNRKRSAPQRDSSMRTGRSAVPESVSP